MKRKNAMGPWLLTRGATDSSHGSCSDNCGPRRTRDWQLALVRESQYDSWTVQA